MQLTSKKREFPTGNFALTTALLTTGFKLEGFCNTYSHPDRPERDRGGRLRKLGAIRFVIEREHDSMVLDDALKAYDGELTPGVELDKLLEGGGSADKADVRRLLGLAYVECARNALANLKAVKKIPHQMPAHIRFIKDDGMPTIVSENMDKEDAMKWGVDLGEHKFNPMPL